MLKRFGIPALALASALAIAVPSLTLAADRGNQRGGHETTARQDFRGRGDDHDRGDRHFDRDDQRFDRDDRGFNFGFYAAPAPVPAPAATGYYDQYGVWHPYGFYDQNGIWHPYAY